MPLPLPSLPCPPSYLYLGMMHQAATHWCFHMGRWAKWFRSIRRGAVTVAKTVVEGRHATRSNPNLLYQFFLWFWGSCFIFLKCFFLYNVSWFHINVWKKGHFIRQFSTKNGVPLIVNLVNFPIKLTEYVRTTFNVGGFVQKPSVKGFHWWSVGQVVLGYDEVEHDGGKPEAEQNPISSWQAGGTEYICSSEFSPFSIWPHLGPEPMGWHHLHTRHIFLT